MQFVLKRMLVGLTFIFALGSLLIWSYDTDEENGFVTHVDAKPLAADVAQHG